jgi:ribulose-bisphosphate carboxylase large chain
MDGETMRDPRSVRCTYYLESEIDPEKAAAIMAGEQSSGTFLPVPGESARIRERHAARISNVQELGFCRPSLPSRSTPEKVRAALVTVDFPMENVGTDLATLQTAIAGNLFELGDLYACRLQDIALPEDFVAAHPGPAFGIEGTRKLISDVQGVMVGTIVKPNVGLSEEEFRLVVRDLALASIDLIKDDELMTDPAYLPLERRVAVATEEIRAAEQVTGHSTMYAFNITGDLAGLRKRHDLVVEAGGRCVMLNIPVMGLPALAMLRSFAEVPIHGHRAGLAASMRSKALGMDYRVWQQMARLAGADHLHASGLGSKFYETDQEVAGNVRSLLEPLGDTLTPVPTLSSGQNVTTAAPTYAAVGSTDLLMLAGGGVAAHPDGPAAGVRSLREAWAAAIDGVPLTRAARLAADAGNPALQHALEKFAAPAPQGSE